MAIEYINVGNIANDGTGDDLREAMIKINNNFEELDLKAVQDIPIENIGSLGQGVYAGVIEGIQSFKRLVPGQNVSLSATDTAITINTTESLEELLVISDNGSIRITNGQSLGITGGTGITTSTNGQTLNLSLDNTNILSSDTLPELTANMNANSNNIINANLIVANTFNGELQGNVWGIDIRDIGPYLAGFDFGQAREVYKNAIEFILSQIDVEFGSIDPESGEQVDLGYIA